jgi:hypothetical protein
MAGFTYKRVLYSGLDMVVLCLIPLPLAVHTAWHNIDRFSTYELGGKWAMGHIRLLFA